MHIFRQSLQEAVHRVGSKSGSFVTSARQQAILKKPMAA